MEPIRPSTDVTRLSDVTIANDCLDMCKNFAVRYTFAAGESSKHDLRRTMSDFSRDNLEMAEDLFQWLSTQGWYPVQRLPEQQITQVQQLYQPVG